MPFLKEGEIRRRKKCSEHLKELNRNVGETEVDKTDADQTYANPGTDYKDMCWQDGRRIVELQTLAEQLNACDGYDTPLNLMNIEQDTCVRVRQLLIYSLYSFIYFILGCVALSSNPRKTAGNIPRRYTH
jgi:hypothetical protein